MSPQKLTEDQLRRCEENRQRALAIRAKKIQEATVINGINKSIPINPLTSSTNYSHKTSSIVKAKPQPKENSQVIKPLWTAGSKNGTQVVVGSCVMSTRQRFQVEMDYHQPSINVFKKISSRSYDAVTKRWSFDIKYHDILISQLKELPTAVVGALPKYVFDIFMKAPSTKIIEEADFSNLDPELVDAFMPFQKDGVNFGIMNKGRVILADDMGLGKTIQAIGISAYYMSEWPLLVVTPSSVRYVWEEAFHRWLPSVHANDINIVNTQKDCLLVGRIVILSYDMLSRKEKDIVNRNFKVLIFDESHFLKNFKSARTKTAMNVVRHASRVILLSGTPALSRPVELYTQINIVKPKLFPNYNAFGLRYCNGKQMPWGWDYSGSSNMAELQLILEETVLLRRLKSEVISQLPAKQRQMILLDPSQVVINKHIETLNQEMSRTTLVGMERRGVLLQFYHLTGISKIPAICNYVEELLETTNKFICFAHHQQVLDAICELVYQKKCDFIRIDGSTSAENRKICCDKFQYSDACRVAILSITAANAGINLTAASLVIFAELFWNPGILTQAEDRAHRIGQQDCVIVRYLVARGTADDYIWPLIQKKLDTLSKAGLNKDNFTDASMECMSLNTCRQKTIESFFDKKHDNDDDEQFWESMCLDSLDEVAQKRMKMT